MGFSFSIGGGSFNVSLGDKVECPCCGKKISKSHPVVRGHFKNNKEYIWTEILNSTADVEDLNFRCPECGFSYLLPQMLTVVAPQCLKFMKNDKEYQRILRSDMPDSVKSWLCAAILLSAAQHYGFAGHSFRKAADYYDVRNQESENKVYALKSAYNMHIACADGKEQEDQIPTQQEVQNRLVAGIVAADDLRRLGEFEAAAQVFNNVINFFNMDLSLPNNRAVAQLQQWIQQEDANFYSLDI